jgi:hypothetical protein
MATKEIGERGIFSMSSRLTLNGTYGLLPRSPRLHLELVRQKMQQFQSQMLVVQRQGIYYDALESCSTAHRTLISRFGETEQKERLAPFFSRLRRDKDRSRLRSSRKACPEFGKLCVRFEGYGYA